MLRCQRQEQHSRRPCRCCTGGRHAAAARWWVRSPASGRCCDGCEGGMDSRCHPFLPRFGAGAGASAAALSPSHGVALAPHLAPPSPLVLPLSAVRHHSSSAQLVRRAMWRAAAACAVEKRTNWAGSARSVERGLHRAEKMRGHGWMVAAAAHACRDPAKRGSFLSTGTSTAQLQRPSPTSAWYAACSA